MKSLAVLAAVCVQVAAIDVLRSNRGSSTHTLCNGADPVAISDTYGYCNVEPTTANANALRGAVADAMVALLDGFSDVISNAEQAQGSKGQNMAAFKQYISSAKGHLDDWKNNEVNSKFSLPISVKPNEQGNLAMQRIQIEVGKYPYHATLCSNSRVLCSDFDTPDALAHRFFPANTPVSNVIENWKNQQVCTPDALVAWYKEGVAAQSQYDIVTAERMGGWFALKADKALTYNRVKLAFSTENTPKVIPVSHVIHVSLFKCDWDNEVNDDNSGAVEALEDAIVKALANIPIRLDAASVECS